MLTSDRSINEYVIENFRVHTGAKFVKIILLMYISIRYYFCVIKKFNSHVVTPPEPPPPPQDTADLINFILKSLNDHFSYIKTTDTIFAIFSECLYPSDEKRYLMMKFSDFFFEMILFETRSIKVSKFNFQSHWRIRILKEPSVVNACFKFYLYFTNWQFFEFLQYFSSSTVCALFE